MAKAVWFQLFFHISFIPISSPKNFTRGIVGGVTESGGA
jgi:hypothetical protein